jgi:membrane associated rhomboid family serine protease
MAVSANTLIIIATVILSLSALQNQNLFYRLKFNAYLIHQYRQWPRLFTAGFIHADFLHLFFNMFVLYMFGRYAEQFFISLVRNEFLGSLAYLIFYLAALPMSGLYSLEKHKNDPGYNAVGASGAVSAVLFCFIMQQPFSRLIIFPIPFPVPAIVFGVVYLAYSWYMGKRNVDNIGHDAHFFGALFGVAVTLISKPSLLQTLTNSL